MLRRVVAVARAAALSLSALLWAAPAAAQWTAVGTLNTPRQGATATVLPTGKVLVAGGANTFGALMSAELYNPANGSFAFAGSMTTARQWATATLMRNGSVLVAGGASSVSAEKYDPVSGTFSFAGFLASARSNATATLLLDGRVLIAGGLGGGMTLASAELYDPTTGLFSSTGAMTSPRYNACATLLPDGRVLIAGGHLIGFLSLSEASAEIYDPASGTFTTTGGMAAAREQASMTLLATGKVLVAGGLSISVVSSSVLAGTELFDPTTGTWTVATPFVHPRYAAFAAQLPNGKVLIAGGYGVIGGNGFLASAEIYDVAANVVSPAPDMLNARDGAAVALLPNAQLLVAGGVNSNGFLVNAERFETGPGSFSATGSLPGPAQAPLATILPDGRVLVLGAVPNQIYDPSSGTFAATGALLAGGGGQTFTLLGNGQVLLAAGGFNSSTAELYDPQTGTFSLSGNATARRGAPTATLLPSGKVLFAGGYDINGNFTPLRSAETYDPAAGTFTATLAMNVARSQASATLLPNGKVLIAGGDVGSNIGMATTAAELYDPAIGLFSNTGNLGTARYLATATLLPNGKVLIAGGYTTAGVTATAELYDPVAGTFSAAGSLVHARRSATATLLPNGKVLIAGGNGGGVNGTVNAAQATTEIYDPVTATFSAGPNMTSKRQSASATLLPNGKVLIVAGYIDTSGNVLSSAELYDPGLGIVDARRPTIDQIAFTAQVQPLALQIDGNGLRASTEQTAGAMIGSEGSAGGTQNAAINYPILQIQRIDNEQQFFVASDPTQPWSDTHFVTTTLSGFANGFYRATLFVNGIPSQARLFSVTPATRMSIVDGDQQTAQVNTAFALPLRVVVTDAADNPVQGVAVNYDCFAAANGACVYSSNAVNTDSQGIAAFNVTADTKVGSYTVRPNVAQRFNAVFHLANTAGPAAHITVAGGDMQTAQVGTAFASMLQATATDTFGNPLVGASVTFTALGAIANATLSSMTAMTNASGVAAVSATANLIAGTYFVSANINNLGQPAVFTLTNLRGPAALVAAQNGPAFSGTAGLPLATPPVVVVTDAFGNPVPGVLVDFVTVGASGSITGDSPLTDANGLAAVGSWILGANPGTNTLQASANGLGGSPVTFTADGAANVDVAVILTTNGKAYVQYGHTLDYVIVVTASGLSNASAVEVTDMLSPILDIAHAHWICIPATGASCDPSGNGNLVGVNASIPTGSSVTLVLSANVVGDPSGELIMDSASVVTDGDTNSANNSATLSIQAVIFRNSFEEGGDGAN